MIAAGLYDEVSRDINPRNFRLTSTGCRQVEITLVQSERDFAPLELVLMMEQRGYRSATIEELLALGSERPDLQRNIPIVTTGVARVVGKLG